MLTEKRFNLMELNSTITYKWKLCMILSLFSCLIILLYLNPNDQNLWYSPAKNSPLDVAEAPMSSTTIFEHPKPSMLSTISPPAARASLKNKTTQLDDFTSNQDEIKEPKSTQLDNTEKPTMNIAEKKCNIFDGRWVYKPDKKPYYDSNTCPFIEEKMNCQKNGRPDFEYEKWRWEAKDCNIPS